MDTLLSGFINEEYFVVPKNKDYDSIKNKAFRFKDDQWDLTSLVEYPENYNKGKRYIDFSSFPKNIRPIFKRTVFHQLAYIKPITIAGKINNTKSCIIRFMKEYGLSSMKQFDTEVFLNFNAWLRETYITKRLLDKKKPLSNRTLYQKAAFIYRLLEISRENAWEDGPNENIYLGDTSLIEIWELTNKESREKSIKTAESRLIPRSVWNKIVNAARLEEKYRMAGSKAIVYKIGEAKGIKAVNFSKYLILTLAWTGLRISEILMLKNGCVFQDKWGYHWLRRKTTKTVDESTEGDIRIPQELYDVLLELQNLTIKYREQSGIDRLFFSVGGGNSTGNKIKPVMTDAVKSTFMKYFRKRNPIFGDDGELYHYTPHDFRHTLASILVNDFNVSITTMMRHYAHMSLEMTMHYTHLSKEKLKKRALMGIINTDKILFSGEEGSKFVKAINEAKVEQDLDTALSKLANAFGINSLPNGICIYDYRRGHCPNLGVSSCWEIGCNSFVTSDSFLMNFEHERDILEAQIKRDDNLKQLASAKMKRHKYNKIVRIIGELKT